MLPEWLTALPQWLLAGLGVGSLASLVVAGIFVVGDRLYPTAGSGTARRVDGTDRRRAEIRSYLTAIGEPFAEDHPVHGHAVAFFLPTREVAVTFDAKAYFDIERAGTRAVLCEHEMPGTALGRRLPFEVPEGVSETDAADPVRRSFELLGVGATASPEEITAAYRRKVIEAHPDHGGTREEFQRLREAYATAKNHAD